MRDGKKKEKRKHVTDTGERYREALKYSFILVRGGSMSGLAFRSPMICAINFTITKRGYTPIKRV